MPKIKSVCFVQKDYANISPQIAMYNEIELLNIK
jgi:hypothetical protein